MRIKGKHWKKTRCCGQRKVLKTVQQPKAFGLGMETRVAFVCVSCGKGEILPPDVVQAWQQELAR